MSQVAKGGAVFSTALALFMLLPANGILIAVAILFAIRPREPWRP